MFFDTFKAIETLEPLDSLEAVDVFNPMMHFLQE